MSRPLVPSAPAVFRALTGRCRHTVWLDSARPHARLAQWSLLAGDPLAVLSFDALDAGGAASGHWRTFSGGDQRSAPLAAGDPLAFVESALAATVGETEAWRRTGRARTANAPSFTGGWIVVLGYDLKGALERLPPARPDALGLPVVWMAYYPAAVLFDHRRADAGTIEVAPAAPTRPLGPPFPDGLSVPAHEPDRSRATLEAYLSAAGSQGHPGDARLSRLEVPPEGGRDARPPAAPAGDIQALSNLPARADYEALVARVVEHVRAGDLFQANLAQRFTIPVRAAPAVLYERLRRSNPAPFSGFVDLGKGRAIATTSPERYLRFCGNRVETSPIKGTAPQRPGDLAYNRRMAAQLDASQKDAAELNMIVDLARNDLARIAEPGSVIVEYAGELQTFETVVHRVATVSATARPGAGVVDVVRASFPAGSITGAPKIRAMEIIDALEPSPRGLYTGTLGYVSHSGVADFNLLIRTALIGPPRADGTRLASVSVGGGITALSDPAAEFEETLDKARGMFAALAPEEAGAEFSAGAGSSGAARAAPPPAPEDESEDAARTPWQLGCVLVSVPALLFGFALISERLGLVLNARLLTAIGAVVLVALAFAQRCRRRQRQSSGAERVPENNLC